MARGDFSFLAYVTEITTNTIGTFAAAGHQDAKPLELARLNGSARP